MNFKRDFECPTGWSDCDSCGDRIRQDCEDVVVCGRRPKQFSCVCGSRNFTLHWKTMTEVDFSQEGAVEGHPFLRNVEERFDSFICFECGEEVPEEQAQEMLKEVL